MCLCMNNKILTKPKKEAIANPTLKLASSLQSLLILVK